MKAFKKLALLAVLLTAAFGFVSCSDDEDDDPSLVTEWSYSEKTDDYSYALALYFYDDGSFKMTSVYKNTEKTDENSSSGSYSGDTTADGTITLTSGEAKTTAVISGSKLSLKENDETVVFTKVTLGNNESH